MNQVGPSSWAGILSKIAPTTIQCNRDRNPWHGCKPQLNNEFGAEFFEVGTCQTSETIRPWEMVPILASAPCKVPFVAEDSMMDELPPQLVSSGPFPQIQPLPNPSQNEENRQLLKTQFSPVPDMTTKQSLVEGEGMNGMTWPALSTRYTPMEVSLSRAFVNDL